MATTSELLVVDGAERQREAIRRRLEEEGYVVTGVASSEEALGLVSRKFFPVALVDLDVDREGGGLALLRDIRAQSRPTSLVMLTSRPEYGAAVEAFRLGVLDVVHKVRGALDYLVPVVARAVERFEAEEGDALYREVRGVLDEGLKVMIEQSKTVYDHLSQAAAPLRPRVLVVDGDSDFLRELSYLVKERDWDITGEMTGGGAMDKGLSTPFDIIASRDELPDLRGSMVLRSIQTQRSEILGLLYSAADDTGRIERMERGQIQDTERPFDGAQHLVDKIQELADALGTRAQERRIIQAFRGDHREFLRRYAELKLKIDRLVYD